MSLFTLAIDKAAARIARQALCDLIVYAPEREFLAVRVIIRALYHA